MTAWPRRSVLRPALCLALGTGSSGGLAQKLLPPAEGLYHSAYADFGPGASEVSVGAIADFEALAGKRLVWAYFSDEWIDGEIRFPAGNVTACREAGVVPYVRMMPWSVPKSEYGPDPSITLRKIIDSWYDTWLRAWARAARDSGGPLMVEFGPEANGEWFPWNGRWNGGGATQAYGDPSWPDGPERFRDAFRHVVRLFREEGAHNVTWALHLDTAPDPQAPWNAMRWYYPGDEYVDWISLSVFGAQLPTHEWLTFSGKLASKYDEAAALAKDKPIAVAEFGVIEDARDPRRKALWLDDAFSSLTSGRFPRVKAVSYWHSPGWLPEGKASFRIDTSDEALRMYRSHVALPIWNDVPRYADR